MNVKHAPGAVTVRFSCTEAAEVGLPPTPVKIEYRNGLLDTYSTWADKSPCFAPGIDRLIAIADKAVYH